MTIRVIAVLSVLLGVLCFAFGAMAQEGYEFSRGAQEERLMISDDLDDRLLGPQEVERAKYVVMAIGFCLATSVVGGAFSQSRVAKAALEGIARNPGSSGKVFLPFILGMVLIESLVIYALVVSLLLIGKV